MYQSKFDLTAAVPFEDPIVLADVEDQREASPSRIFAAIIILALPVILLGALARSIGRDVVSIGRGIGRFYRDLSTDLSRP